MSTLKPQAIAAALIALSLTTAVGAQPRAADQIRIDNFARVNASYFRGAQPEGSDYAALAALGVKTVINLTSFDAQAGEQASVERHGMRYLPIPMTTRTPPTVEELDTFLSTVTDPANQPVYVHCVGGRHRTGVMTAAYRMTRDGLTGAEAFDEMKRFKYGPDLLHPEFKAFVKAFDPVTRTSAVKAGR